MLIILNTMKIWKSLGVNSTDIDFSAVDTRTKDLGEVPTISEMCVLSINFINSYCNLNILVQWGPFLPSFLYSSWSSEKRVTHGFHKKRWRKFRIMFFYLGHFSIRERNISLFLFVFHSNSDFLHVFYILNFETTLMEGT